MVLLCSRFILHSLPRWPPLISPLFPYTTLFRSDFSPVDLKPEPAFRSASLAGSDLSSVSESVLRPERSEEHTSELQSRGHLVCRLLLEKKKKLDLTNQTVRG